MSGGRNRSAFLRKRALSSLYSLQPRESIELILSFCFEGADLYNTVNALFERFYSAQNILNADYESLCSVPGMTGSAAVLILLMPRLYDVSNKMRYQRLNLKRRAEACTYFTAQFRGAATEQFMIACLDKNGAVKKCITVGKGTSFSVNVDTQDLVRRVAQTGCRLCVASHNHPGGNCTASAQDIESTEKLAEMFRKVGIQLLDHIVVGRDGARSVYSEENNVR